MPTVSAVIDVYNILLCLLLAGAALAGGARRSVPRRRYMQLCGLNAAMSLGDLLAHHGRGMLTPIGCLLLYGCPAVLALVLAGYFCSILQPRQARVLLTVCTALCALALALGLLSLYNGICYQLLPGSLYRRGWAFYLAPALAGLILAGAGLLLVRCRLPAPDRALLLGCLLLPAAACVIQLRRNDAAWLSAGVTLSLLLLAAQAERARARQRRAFAQTATVLQTDLLLGQIQPHFLFNTLTTLRGLCRTDPARAEQAVSDLASFLRGNLDALTSHAPIPFAQELAHVRFFVGLEQLRFGSRLRVIYDIGADRFSLPPLSLQPVVENAIRHGVLKRENGGTVAIRTWEETDSFRILVSDDGVGFSARPDDRPHVGLDNVARRLEALCGGTLRIVSPPDGAGAAVMLSIPKEEST